MLSNLQKPFTLDLRSLGLFRICLGALLILNLLSRFMGIEAHYSDSGSLPRHLTDWMQNSHFVWSTPHFWSGNENFQVGLILFQIALAAALMVGYKTTFALVASWYLYVSLEIRNGFVLSGASTVYRLLLFWSIFLPMNEHFSIDRLKQKERRLTECSPATFAFIMQIFCLYFFTWLLKSPIGWFTKAHAVDLSLNMDQLVTSAGFFLRDFSAELTAACARITYVIEILIPFFLIFPFKSNLGRWASILLIGILHFSILFFLQLGLFPAVCLSYCFALIPSEAWPKRPPMPEAAASCSNRSFQTFTNIFILTACALVFLFNFYGLHRDVKEIPSLVSYPTQSLRLKQKWKLYAPVPTGTSRDYLLTGKTDSGNEVKMGTLSGSKLNASSPLANDLHGQLWRSYFFGLHAHGHLERLPYFADYLCRKWNQNYSKGTDIQAISIKTRLVRYDPETRLKRPPEIEPLITNYQCT